MLTHGAPSRVRHDGCDLIRADVFAACDGELSPTSLALIDAHLVSCTACRERFSADATFQHVVRRALSLTPAPQALRDRVALLLHSLAREIAPA